MGRLGGWVTVNDSALLMVTGNVARYDQVGRKFGGRTTLRVKCLCNRCGYYSISWGFFLVGFSRGILGARSGDNLTVVQRMN